MSNKTALFIIPPTCRVTIKSLVKLTCIFEDEHFYRYRFSYHEECEHGLAHVEAMPPVMIGDLSVTFTN